MKILLLRDNIVSPATAIVRKNKTANKLYFYIPHGTRLPGLFAYNMGVNYKDFAPKNENEELKLDGNNYIILPVRKDDKIVTDSNNNTIYYVAKDYNTSHSDDIILFWEIPNKKYTDVEFKVSGEVEVIAKGFSGKQRGTELYKSPAPVLEIYGDCQFEWSGKSDTGIVGQSIKYKYSDSNSWNIVNIKK